MQQHDQGLGDAKHAALAELLTKAIDKEPVYGRMQHKHNSTGGDLGPHNALELQVSVGGH